MEAIKKLQIFRKSFGLGFIVKQIIDSLSFLFLLAHIGLDFNLKKKCFNNRANYENLDLSYWVQSQVTSSKTLKMVLDASLPNTQPYKVGIKGRVKQSREKSNAVP